jgi:uncharacterized protein YecT (DUF1311 family)
MALRRVGCSGACPFPGAGHIPFSSRKILCFCREVLTSAYAGSAVNGASVLVMLFGASLNFGFVSQASAIDCAKAASAVEKAICGSESLRKADATLRDLYFAVLRKLEGARHQLLIDSQRQWLSDRDQECGEDTDSCVAQAIATRQSVIEVCFAGSSEPEAAGAAAAISCPYYLHRECPMQQANGSPRLSAYPFLVEKLIAYMEKSASYFDCEADPEATYDPSQNEQTVNYSIVTERPGLVCVDESEDGYYAGAGHPFAQGNMECFDTATHAKIEFQTVFPALAAGSPELDKIIALVDGHLELGCCGNDATNEGTFADLGKEGDAGPTGWAVNDAGDLILAFAYSAFGRSFQATATVPRAAFIDLVAAKYRSVFEPAPVAE